MQVADSLHHHTDQQSTMIFTAMRVFGIYSLFFSVAILASPLPDPAVTIPVEPFIRHRNSLTITLHPTFSEPQEYVLSYERLGCGILALVNAALRKASYDPHAPWQDNKVDISHPMIGLAFELRPEGDDPLRRLTIQVVSDVGDTLLDWAEEEIKTKGMGTMAGGMSVRVTNEAHPEFIVAEGKFTVLRRVEQPDYGVGDEILPAGAVGEGRCSPIQIA